MWSALRGSDHGTRYWPGSSSELGNQHPSEDLTVPVMLGHRDPGFFMTTASILVVYPD